MAADLSRKAHEIWPWIPVFKVVAETEHLPTAAQRLHVSPSALSRTVRLIEEALGQTLFVRTSRRIVLNATGQRLLEAARRSMISLEQSMHDVLERDFSGSYRVASLGVLTDYYVLPALLDVRARHPGVVPCMSTLSSREANQRLASGLVEVAFYYDATSMDGIACRRIGLHTNALYCGRGHPLFGRRGVALGELARHEFSVAAIGDRGTPMDSWPVELPRRVGFQILMLSTNVHVSLSGRYVTVLPDVVAAPHVEAGNLFRLDPDLVPPTEVFAACRSEDSDNSFTSEVIAEVEARLARAVAARPAARSGLGRGVGAARRAARTARKRRKRRR